jgi:DNA-binding CsgD family transcriptional regulator
MVERGHDSPAMAAEAVAVLEHSPSRLELARALIGQGVALRRGGSRTEAREPLRRGLAMAQEFGALALERQATDELVATGARPRPPGARGADALTPGEARVAHMAIDGLTNREIAQALFVTPKAVQFHLGNVYRKLGVQRAGLAEALER